MASQKLLKWKLMQLIERNVLKVGGSIFGGYCRDKIIHDHYATEFYKMHNENRDKYGDASFDPETSLRTLIPNDIDCFMPSSKVEIFKKNLINEKLYIGENWSGDANLYFADAPDCIRHDKIQVSFEVHGILKRMMNLCNVKVSLDILHAADEVAGALQPPFGCVDFACNAIVLNPDGEYKLNVQYGKHTPHPKHKLQVLNQTIDDIIEKRAKIVNKDAPPRHRILKMIAKGWTIESDSLELAKASADQLEEGDVCMICLCELKEKFYTTRFKCCMASRMHAHCAKKYFEQTKPETCPTCRKDVSISTCDGCLVGISY